MKVRDLFKNKTEGLAEIGQPGPSDKQDKRAREVEEKWIRFRDKSLDWRTEAVSCEKFRNGLQWTKAQIAELKRKRQAPIVVNLISPSIDQLKAMLTSNEPRFNAMPREGSDRDTSKLFSDIFSWIWYFNNGNAKFKQVIDNYSVRGMGYLMAWWDPGADFGKGEVIIDTLNPMDVYVDPNSECPHLSDAESIIISKDFTAEQIQRNLRIGSDFLKKCRTTDHESDVGFDPTEMPIIDNQDSADEENAEYRVMDHYAMALRPFYHYRYEEYEYDIEKQASKEYEEAPVLRIDQTDLQSQQTRTEWIVEEDEMTEWAQTIEQLGNVFHFIQTEDPQTGEMVEQPQPGPAMEGSQATRQLEVQDAMIADVIASGAMERNAYTKQQIYRDLIIGGRKYFSGWTGTMRYPIGAFPNRHNRNPYPVSDVTLAKDLQKEMNKIRSIILTHAANTAGVTVGVPKGSMDKKEMEQEMEKSGTKIFEYDAVDGGQPHYIHPPQLPGHFYQAEDKIRETIYEIFGIYPFMSGGEQGHSTSSGILIMDEFAQRRIAAKRANIEESLNQFGKVVVELVQQHYTEEKSIRLVQPSGRYNQIDLNVPVYDQFNERLLHRINDVTIGRYDVIVASGSTLPTNRITRMEYYMKLYQAGLVDQYEVLKNVDEVDVEGVMERMGLLNQLQGQLEQMQQEIKNLEGDLQTADREAVGARKRVEVEKFKAQLTSMQSEIDKQLNVSKEREMSGFREGLSRQQGGGEGKQAGRGEPAPVMLDEELYSELNQL